MLLSAFWIQRWGFELEETRFGVTVVLRRNGFFRLRYQMAVNHQEVSKELSLKRSCCMPVCCDQGNEFEYEGYVFKLVFAPWFI